MCECDCCCKCKCKEEYTQDFCNIKNDIKNCAGFISICPQNSYSFKLKMSSSETFYLNPCIQYINKLGYKMTEIDSYGKTINMTFSKC